MSEEFKYGTAENMSETTYLRQGGHLVASVYLWPFVTIAFNCIYSTLLVLVTLYSYF